jgi:hypothetical protein
MGHLSKTWVRLLISLFGGAFLAELRDIQTGAAFGPRDGSDPKALVYAVLIYAILTGGVWWYNWSQAKK